tara:strand:- start:4555 stop:4971 length:417 start_codon:yes stop_codon:yes gene_type:complete
MSTNIKIKEIKEMFMIFDDPMDKYMQIIELGKKNIGINEKDKNDKNRIYGCTSLAWVKVIKNNDKYNIEIDSDTFIVKGLLSILKYIIDNSTEDEINQIDINSILSDIGLKNSITSQRTNGFLNAINKIKKQIKEYNV